MKSKSSRTAGFTLVEIMIVVAIIGLLAAIAIPNYVHARLRAQRTVCINNLRQIDGAKQQWALEYRGGTSATPTEDNLRPYLGRGAGTLPNCPADASASFGTSYGINDLQTAPVCLVSPGGEGDAMGHRLPN
jgi:prepilin-type N-terminal cleavage/methylation domain-containing protein